VAAKQACDRPFELLDAAAPFFDENGPETVERILLRVCGKAVDDHR
jgi:hypothetical protein